MFFIIYIAWGSDWYWTIFLLNASEDVDLVKEDELVSDEKLNLVEPHGEQIGMCKPNNLKFY